MYIFKIVYGSLSAFKSCAIIINYIYNIQPENKSIYLMYITGGLGGGVIVEKNIEKLKFSLKSY